MVDEYSSFVHGHLAAPTDDVVGRFPCVDHPADAERRDVKVATATVDGQLADDLRWRVTPALLAHGP